MLLDRENFTQTIEHIYRQLNRINQISRLELRVDSIREQYQTQLQNIQNLRRSYDSPEHIRAYLVHVYERLVMEQRQSIESEKTTQRSSIVGSSRSPSTSNANSKAPSVTSNDRNTTNSEPKDHPLNKLTNTLNISSTTLLDVPRNAQPASSEQLNIRMHAEIARTQEQMDSSRSSEVRILEANMFASTDSLHTREAQSKKQIEHKKQLLKSNMRTIDDLRGSIDDMEHEMQVIAMASAEAKRLLAEKKLEMKSTVEELVQLNRMMESINREIVACIREFQTQLAALEDDRQRILADETLTDEERAQRLAELDKRIEEMKLKHASTLRMLEEHRDEMTERTEKVSQSITAMREMLLIGLQKEIDELERSKIGRSPSEVERIDEQIRQLLEKTKEIVGVGIDRSSSDERVKGFVPKYATDEHGRYYLNADGDKIYKTDSTASEYMIQDGVRLKIRSALKLLTDEVGDYYLDADGVKIYHRCYENDEHGRYYLNDEGNRVYRRGPYTSEYMLIDGVFVKVRDAIGESDGEKEEVELSAMEQLGE